jgi:hypothetical protein
LIYVIILSQKNVERSFFIHKNKAPRKECYHNQKMEAMSQNGSLTDINKYVISVETKSMIAADNRCLRTARQIQYLGLEP